MKWWGFFALAVCAHSATLSVSITKCRPDGLARATVTWTSPDPGPVQVRVNGDPMTGFGAASASSQTGDWVSDGLLFTLVDANGNELARATAKVRCTPDPNSYFPLQLGNHWVYRVDSRVGTANYTVWEVLRVETVGSQDWFAVSQGGNEVLYRQDSAGRIYQRSGDTDILWLDPSAARVSAVGNALGTFPDGLIDQRSQTLVQETASFVQGVGLLTSQSTLIAGSSGGFLNSLDLVYAKIGGTLVLGAHIPSLELSIESKTLKITQRQVTNCAVPCYFAACGLTPGADPPGTYKPCFQTRVRTVDGAGEIAVELIDRTGQVVHRSTQQAPEDREAIRVFQIPLYAAPNNPLPQGEYSVRAVAGDASATTTVRIE